MKLPADFLEDMKEILKDEFDEFLASYEDEPAYGLRVNSLKGVSVDTLRNKGNFTLEEVSWCSDGFYALKTERPGMSVFHEAGAFYIQEPSAMLPGVLVDAKPGDFVLDLCAAPGGKSTQIGASMKGQGLLVSNEIIPSRAKILSQNIERMGISNAIVTNESPDRLADRFYEFFDKIVVDAPCSGEGMFRKDENAIEEWSEDNVKMCAERQSDILDQAAHMLKKGGRLVYSTCTFSYDENEGTILKFLEKHPDFEIRDDLHKASHRMWPHKIKGEGHFACVLYKKSGEDAECEPFDVQGSSGNGEILDADSYKNNPKKYQKKNKKGKKNKRRNGENSGASFASSLKLVREFLDDYLVEDLSDFKDEDFLLNLNSGLISDENTVCFGDEIYLLPSGFVRKLGKGFLSGLKVVRPGLHLGKIKKNRFEPSHALARALCFEQFSNIYEADEKEGKAFIEGLSINCKSEDKTKNGWCLVCYEGLVLGFGKCSNNVIKNHYPIGLRRILG